MISLPKLRAFKLVPPPANTPPIWTSYLIYLTYKSLDLSIGIASTEKKSSQILEPFVSHPPSPRLRIHTLLCLRGPARQLRYLSLFGQKRPPTTELTGFFQQ